MTKIKSSMVSAKEKPNIKIMEENDGEESLVELKMK